MALAGISTDQLLEGDLFEILGIQDASSEVKNKIVEAMMTTIDARVATRVAKLLGNKRSEEFKKIADQSDPKELADYLAKQDVDLPQIVSEEATRHRVEIIELARLAAQG